MKVRDQSVDLHQGTLSQLLLHNLAQHSALLIQSSYNTTLVSLAPRVDI